MKMMSKFVLSALFVMVTASAVHAGTETPQAPVSPDFTVRSGDVLQVTVWKEEGLDREVIVLPDGNLSFPLIGTVHVQDLTLAAVQDMIKTKLKDTIPEASVSVTVKAPLGHTVSVLGQVGKPGEIVMARQMTVMQALSQAGGLTPFAKEGGIKILRTIKGQKTSLDYPYDDIADGQDLEKDIDLVPGDVVVVPTAGLF